MLLSEIMIKSGKETVDGISGYGGVFESFSFAYLHWSASKLSLMAAWCWSKWACSTAM